MGAKLSAPRGSTRQQVPNPSTSISTSNDEHDSFIELLKPDCMKPRKKRRGKEKKNVKWVSKKRIMASPEKEPDSFYGGELHVFKQYEKVYTQPYSFSTPSSFYRLRDKVIVNSSLKRDKSKNGEEEEEFYSLVSSLSTGSGSEKLKKKVSFRSPDESDIIFFYSPRNRFEGDEELWQC